MTITRKAFCERLLSGSVLLLFSGCGGGGGYSSSPSPSPSPAPSSAGVQSCSATQITGNHGHALTVPASDLNSTVAMTYSIQGMADHNHTVTIGPAQFAQLKAGQPVTITSSETLSHDHDVTITCV